MSLTYSSAISAVRAKCNCLILMEDGTPKGDMILAYRDMNAPPAYFLSPCPFHLFQVNFEFNFHFKASPLLFSADSGSL